MTSTGPDSGTMPGSIAGGRPAWRAALWLSFLGPFFFLSYGLANGLAAQQENVTSLVFAWENNIPFLPWTIVPYWSIDALYALSLFICATIRDVDQLAKRLLTAQVIAVACFIAFPLTFSFERPATDGLFGIMFNMLEGFDKPFNQAPSLHIALLVILWTVYARHLAHRWHWLLHGWFALIGLSVLTTYQHHFIDVPTGALLGWFCIWLWPFEGGSAIAGFRRQNDPKAWRLATVYALGAAVMASIALVVNGWALWLLWPSVSLALVSAAYAGLGTAAFQKTPDGRMSPAARWLMAPYLAAAKINSRLWTRREPAPVHVADDVWIGRFPASRDLASHGFASVVDLSAELPAPTYNGRWHALPNLDLLVPGAPALSSAVGVIEERVRSGPVLVCCALGLSRSAAAVACWLLQTGRATDVTHAVQILAVKRPSLVLSDAHLAAIDSAATRERRNQQ